MTPTLGSYREKRRRRLQSALLRWGMGLVVLFSIIAYAYYLGQSQGDASQRVLEDRVTELESQVAQLKGANAQLRETEERFHNLIPNQRYRRLLETLHAKSAAGVKLDRLQFLLDQAQNRDACDEEHRSKRFMVRTSLYQGTDDSVTFDDGAIAVSAKGQSAVNAEGKPEVRFDPTQPIAITLTSIGSADKEETVEGSLPLRHRLVRKDREYRFLFIKDEEPGFLRVTLEICPFP